MVVLVCFLKKKREKKDGMIHSLQSVTVYIAVKEIISDVVLIEIYLIHTLVEAIILILIPAQFVFSVLPWWL